MSRKGKAGPKRGARRPVPRRSAGQRTLYQETLREVCRAYDECRVRTKILADGSVEAQLEFATDFVGRDMIDLESEASWRKLGGMIRFGFFVHVLRSKRFDKGKYSVRSGEQYWYYSYWRPMKDVAYAFENARSDVYEGVARAYGKSARVERISAQFAWVPKG